MKTWARATLLLTLMTLLTGIAYPLVVTGIVQAAFPGPANGSLVLRDGRAVGSERVGQCFDDPSFFRGRPSATGPSPCNASASGGSNLGPTNPALLQAVTDRVAALRAADPDARGPVPADLVTASASGLDPDVSPAGALWQVHRVAKARGLPEDRVRALVEARVEPRLWGVLGEPRVNVLQLNLALQEMSR
jgi:potassium-transporting ATPase KdpC subunit